VSPATVATLPRLLVLTDRTQTASGALASVVRAAVDGGARAIVLREKDLCPSERASMAAGLRRHVDVLIVASDASIAGDGVHLAATDPVPDRRPGLVGRSCHDADELAQAAADGCDYATVSPVFASASKPGHGPPLGIPGLRALAAGSDLPIYALGGVTPGRARSCCDAGAHGVAVMGTIMRSRDPAATVRDYLSALGPAGTAP
jgi:thiamine-phosphate pyrophosphorylase